MPFPHKTLPRAAATLAATLVLALTSCTPARRKTRIRAGLAVVAPTTCELEGQCSSGVHYLPASVGVD